MGIQEIDARIRMVMDSHEDIGTGTVYTVDNQIYVKFNRHDELLGPFVVCEIVAGMVIKLKAGDYSTPIYYVKSIETDNWEYANNIKEHNMIRIAEARATRYVQKYFGTKDIKEIMSILESRFYSSAEKQTVILIISFEEISIWGKPHVRVSIGVSQGLWDIKNKYWVMPLSKIRLGVIKNELDNTLDYIAFSDGENTSAYVGKGTGRGGTSVIRFSRRHIVERINKGTWVITGYFNTDRQVVKVIGGELVELLSIKLGEDIVRVNRTSIEIGNRHMITFTNESGKVLSRGIPRVVILEEDKDSIECSIVDYAADEDDTDDDLELMGVLSLGKNRTLRYKDKEYNYAKISKGIIYGALK